MLLLFLSGNVQFGTKVPEFWRKLLLPHSGTGSSEALVPIYQITQCHIQNYSNHTNHDYQTDNITRLSLTHLQCLTYTHVLSLTHSQTCTRIPMTHSSNFSSFITISPTDMLIHPCSIALPIRHSPNRGLMSNIITERNQLPLAFRH